MPNINLRDARNRDAVVRAETVSQSAVVRYTDKDGGPAKLRKVLKGTLDTSFETLLARHDHDVDKLGAALVAGDPEADIERAGMFIEGPARVYVTSDNRIVYRIVQTEIVRAPDGTEKERRPLKRAAINVDGEFPLSWTGRKVKRADAIGRFVFHQKLQVVHVNGLTYDFLYAMAKELAEADSLLLLGAGKSGKDPLVLRHGATPCRGFLEGRIDGDRYVLLLHLSKMELKRPAPVVLETAAVAAHVAQPAVTAPTAAVAPAPKSVPQPEPAPLAAEAPARTLSVQDVLAATASARTTTTEPVKSAIAETVEASKAQKQRTRAPRKSGAAHVPADSATGSAQAKPKPKRASRAKPAPDERAS